MTGPSIVFTYPTGKTSYEPDDEIAFEVRPGDDNPFTEEVQFAATVTYANGAALRVNAPATITGQVTNVGAPGYTTTRVEGVEGFHYAAELS
jgi:hypothetical protein